MTLFTWAVGDEGYHSTNTQGDIYWHRDPFSQCLRLPVINHPINPSTLSPLYSFPCVADWKTGAQNELSDRLFMNVWTRLTHTGSEDTQKGHTSLYSFRKWQEALFRKIAPCYSLHICITLVFWYDNSSVCYTDISICHDLITLCGSEEGSLL